MRKSTGPAVGAIGVVLLVSIPMSRVCADEVDRPSRATAEHAPAATPGDTKTAEGVPEINLLDAQRHGLVSIQAEGGGDGRMTVSVINRTERPLRIVLPPGIIAQGTTGQFAGIGGMGGMGGSMGGMDSGFMGGMGGGMRSVPPTDLPSAWLSPGQTRNLPTRLVVLTPPGPRQSVKLPEKGEPLRLADIADVHENPQVRKALRRLAADGACRSIARLVMWHLTARLDWDTLARLSDGWANRYELTLARDFVDHLDSLPSGETGRVLFEVEGSDAASEITAVEMTSSLRRKVVLGLVADIGIPARPEGPAVALRVAMSVFAVRVLVLGSDGAATRWAPLGTFTVPLSYDGKAPDVERLTDAIAEGALNHLVRVRLSDGVDDKGQTHYQLRIDNASPLVLNGVAAVGATSGPDQAPRVLSGICLSPRRSMTVEASEEVVKSLGLKKGIKLIALDLSGL
jgi:hypothetical protein